MKIHDRIEQNVDGESHLSLVVSQFSLSVPRVWLTGISQLCGVVHVVSLCSALDPFSFHLKPDPRLSPSLLKSRSLLILLRSSSLPLPFLLFELASLLVSYPTSQSSSDTVSTYNISIVGLAWLSSTSSICRRRLLDPYEFDASIYGVARHGTRPSMKSLELPAAVATHANAVNTYAEQISRYLDMRTDGGWSVRHVSLQAQGLSSYSRCEASGLCILPKNVVSLLPDSGSSPGNTYLCNPKRPPVVYPQSDASTGSWGG